MSNGIITPPGMGTPTSPQPAAQMNIKPSELDDVSCDECGNFTFAQVVLMKRMPQLISPTGKEAFIPMQVYACNSCGHINERFIQGMGGWFKSDDEGKDEGTVAEQEAADASVIEGSKLEGMHAVLPTPPELASDDGDSGE
jgi:hypothetical protein